jgi:CelD/BcsL family acetyltransferase involved in cellulose biosynthesis
MSVKRTKVIGQWNEVRRLRTEWDSLLLRSPNPSFFLTWDWIEVWWETYGRQYQPHVIVAYDRDDQLCGIAPFMIRPALPGFGHTIRKLSFIGQGGDTLAEYLDLIVDGAVEERATTALLDTLFESCGSEWHVLDLQLIPGTSTTLHYLSKRGEISWQRLQRESPYLSLPADWGAVLAARSTNFRQQFKNSDNRLKRMGEVRYLLAGLDIPVSDAMDHLVRLNRGRWGDEGRSFRSERYEQFHRELSARACEKNRLLFVVLTVDGNAVAARYDFVFGNKVWCFQGGWETAYQRMRIGTLLTGEVIRRGINLGCTEYDFLAGDSAYKGRWASGSRPLVSAVGLTRTAAAKMYWAATITRRAAGRLVPRSWKEILKKLVKS